MRYSLMRYDDDVVMVSHAAGERPSTDSTVPSCAFVWQLAGHRFAVSCDVIRLRGNGPKKYFISYQ